MARKRKPGPKRSGQGSGEHRGGAQRGGGGGAQSVRRSAATVQIRKAPGGEGWELVHPRCALDRADDLEEVRKMIEAEEIEVGRDELRWLLGGCSDFIDAHKALGEIALLDHDLPLARGHFGYAYQIGAKALDRAGAAALLPYGLPANQAFFEAGKGLAYCLLELGKPEMAAEVIERLLSRDPSDPLGLRGMLPPK